MKAVLLCAMAAAAALLAPIGTIVAEDLQLNSLLYSHEAGTPAQLISINGGECCTDADQALESCCRDPWWGGIEGGLELTLFNVYANHGAGERSGGYSWFHEDPNGTANLRYWLGFRGEEGLGARVRYFSYYSNIDPWPGNPGGAPSPQFFNARLVDLEATGLLSVCKWDFDLSVGIRFSDIRWTGSYPAAFEPGYNFSGAGPTVGVDVRRELIGNLSLVAGVRSSYLLGQTTETGLLNESLHTTCNMTEVRAGVDWRRQMARGCLVIGAAWEQQLYTGLSRRMFTIDPEDVDVTLAGPVFSVSFQR